MKKTITFEGREMTIENNALLPRIYRHTFGRDLIVDMQKLTDAYKKNHDEINTEVLENLAWVMLKAGGEDVGESVEEWLGSLEDTFAIYDIMGDIIELWASGLKTTAKPKKK